MLRQLIRTDFGVDLPISGGEGNSIDNPIMVEKTADYVGTEYTVLKYLGIERRIKWKMVKQFLLEHNNRMIDKIQIETIQLTETEEVTQIENYYFDVTECINQSS